MCSVFIIFFPLNFHYTRVHCFVYVSLIFFPLNFCWSIVGSLVRLFICTLLLIYFHFFFHYKSMSALLTDITMHFVQSVHPFTVVLCVCVFSSLFTCTSLSKWQKTYTSFKLLLLPLLLLCININVPNFIFYFVSKTNYIE